MTFAKQPMKLPKEEGPKFQHTGHRQMLLTGTFNSPGKDVIFDMYVKDDYPINGAGANE